MLPAGRRRALRREVVEGRPVARTMCEAMNSAPSRAPSSGHLRQHSHSIIAHPWYPQAASLENTAPKLIWPSPRERNRPARSTRASTRNRRLAAVAVEFRVLDVECADARVVEIDEGEIIQPLQHEMRGIVVDGATRMIADRLQKPLERRAIEHILARMKLIGDIDAGLVECIEDRPPSAGEFDERLLDQAGGRCGQGRKTAKPARR